MRRLSVPVKFRGRLFTSKHHASINSLLTKHEVHAGKVTGLADSGSKRGLARVRDARELNNELWFSSSPSLGFPEDHEPVEKQKVKLGKTIGILRERLPNLVANPLPQDILSPHITLRLFPSTHPHLPSVSGRLAYTAALWTSPVAWGRMPVVGNVRLDILSERMMRNGHSSSPSTSPTLEKFIVRWKTCVKTKPDVTEQIKKMIGRTKEEANHEFHGLFIFEFDEQGRILSHTIEHVEEGNDWEKTAKLVSVTDWLLGKAWGKKEDVVPELAICRGKKL